MKNIFLGGSHSKRRVAEGFKDAVLTNLKYLAIDEVTKKLTELSIDFESSNTEGSLREYLGRDFLCLCCVAHLSDLAFSELDISD